MSVIELLDNLIMDMTDYIDDYRDTVRRTDSRLTKQEYNIRIDELKSWRKMLKEIREEQNQND